MSDASPTEAGIDALRNEFDARFTLVAPPRPALQAFLRVRAGIELLLPIVHLVSVLPLPRLAAIPLARPGFLGVGAVGGRTVAVHRLAVFIRDSGDAGDTPQRWLIVPSAGGDIAFAVAEVLDRIDIVSTDLAAMTARDGAYAAVASVDGRQVPVIDLPTLVQSLRRPLDAP